jgi:C1A family cysteine protease
MKTISLLLFVVALATSSALAQNAPPHQCPPAGWKQDKAGVRDASFAATRVYRATAIKSKTDLSPKMPPIYDQGMIGSCTGNGLAAILDFARGKQGMAFIGPSRLFIYFAEREIEGTINEDAGAQIRTGIDVLADLGSCKEKTWPYRESQWRTKPGAKCYTEALSFQALHGYKVQNTDGRSIRIALSAGYPVVFGSLLYSQIDLVDYQHPILQMPRKGERTIGGHCMVIVGHDDSRKLYKVRNSWGKAWADSGYFFIPYDYVHSAKITGDCWVIDQAE